MKVKIGIKFQVNEVEKRLQVTLETVENRVVFLEKLNADWQKFDNDLEELRQWTLYRAPTLIQALQSEETEPKERLDSAKVLQISINEKMDVAKSLENQYKNLVEGKNPKLYIFLLLFAIRKAISVVNK